MSALSTSRDSLPTWHPCVDLHFPLSFSFMSLSVFVYCFFFYLLSLSNWKCPWLHYLSERDSLNYPILLQSMALQKHWPATSAPPGAPQQVSWICVHKVCWNVPYPNPPPLRLLSFLQKFLKQRWILPVKTFKEEKKTSLHAGLVSSGRHLFD